MLVSITAEYRLKCEDEGNYLDAGRAHKQLGVLRKQEEKRQQRAVKSRQNVEKDEVLLSHNAQYSEFNDAWDGYMAGNLIGCLILRATLNDHSLNSSEGPLITIS